VRVEDLTDRELMGWYEHWNQSQQTNTEELTADYISRFINYVSKQYEKEAPLGRFHTKWADFIRFASSGVHRDNGESRTGDSDLSGTADSTGDVSESDLDDLPVVQPEREV